MKICDTCKQEKEEIFFYFDYTNDDNRNSSCIKCYKKHKKAEYKKSLRRVKKDKRRVYGKKEIVLYKRYPKSKSAEKIYKAETTPMFMQFNHLIYKHVNNKYGLNFAQLNLLMMVAPITPFPRKDFILCRKIIDFKAKSIMRLFINEGFMYVWKKGVSTDRMPTLYDLTDKGKNLISDIHKWAIGKEDIPDAIEDKSLDIMARLYQHRNSIVP